MDVKYCNYLTCFVDLIIKNMDFINIDTINKSNIFSELVMFI